MAGGLFPRTSILGPNAVYHLLKNGEPERGLNGQNEDQDGEDNDHGLDQGRDGERGLFHEDLLIVVSSLGGLVWFFDCRS